MPVSPTSSSRTGTPGPGEGPGSAQPLRPLQHDAGGRRGRRDLRAHPAADPGHRQCQRLHHAGGAAQRRLRLPPAGEPRPDDRRRRERAIGLAEAQHLVPGRRAADRDRGGPDQGRGARRHGRAGLLDALELRGVVLRHAVQQVRPDLPGLRAGRARLPAPPRGRREPEGARRQRGDGAARHHRGDQDRAGPVPDQPLQPLPDGHDRGRGGAGLQLRAGAGPDAADRRQGAAAGHGL